MNSLLVLSILVFTTSVLGGVVPLFVPQTKDHFLKLFVCLGAGVLLGMSMLHLLPEAAEMMPHAFGRWFLAGFLLLLVLERFAMVHACEEHGCNYHTIGFAAFLGMAVHGLIEGVALTSSLLSSELGLLVFVGIIAHKAPCTFALTSILKLAGKSKQKILAFVLGVSVSVPMGCFIAYHLLAHSQLAETAGALLALSAGTFLYIGACDLLPELHRNDGEKWRRLIAFLVGIGFCFISKLLHD